MNRFEKIGLIERYRDGRQLRGFPGELGKQIINGSLRNGAEQFIAFLIQKLEEGCLKPITGRVTRLCRCHQGAYRL